VVWFWWLPTSCKTCAKAFLRPAARRPFYWLFKVDASPQPSGESFASRGFVFFHSGHALVLLKCQRAEQYGSTGASWPCGPLWIFMRRDVSSLELCCALINRDPSWFNETWLGRIKEDSGDNWRLKVICEAAGMRRDISRRPGMAETSGLLFLLSFSSLKWASRFWFIFSSGCDSWFLLLRSAT